VTFPRHSSSFCFRPEDHIRLPLSTFRLSHFRVLGHFAELSEDGTAFLSAHGEDGGEVLDEQHCVAGCGEDVVFLSCRTQFLQ